MGDTLCFDKWGLFYFCFIYYPLNRLIKIEYHITPKNAFDHIQRIFTYCDCFGSYRESSSDSDCDLDLMMSQDFMMVLDEN